MHICLSAVIAGFAGGHQRLKNLLFPERPKAEKDFLFRVEQQRLGQGI